MIRLALIGVGRWGENIKRTLEGVSDCLLTDAVTTAWRQLLERDDIDGVLIATPAATHADIALPFIAKGLPVFIEKPMTASLPEALTLQAAAEKSGSIVMVGHIHLYNNAYQKAKELAQASGPLRYISFEGMNNGPVRSDISALWDWGAHDVSLALDLLQTEPVHVQAWGLATLRPKTYLFDWASIRMMFPDNIQVTSTVSWLSPEKRKKMTIVGTSSSIVFDDTSNTKVVLYNDMGPHIENDAVIIQQPNISFPAYETSSPLKNELTAFVTAIKTGETPVADLKQGVKVIKILTLAEQSINQKGALLGY